MSEKLRPTIAIVDDEQSIRSLLQSLLVQANFNVETFSDGQSAFSGFQDKKPDLMLLDVSMPGWSGLDVCQQIRENLGDLVTPIVIMTGNDDFHSIEAAFQSGATDFFPKPLNFPLLIQRIRYALRNVQAWEMTANYQNYMLQSEKMSSLGQLAG